MTIELPLAAEFGSHLANGSAAIEYRKIHLDHRLDHVSEIIFDFSGVRAANSSFINALVSGTIEEYGEVILDKIVFKGCNPLLRTLVEAAIDLGLKKHDERLAA